MAKPPVSYEEITRKTVPNPDSSFRPSKEQVAAAFDGTHTRAVDERELHTAVQAALQTHAEGGQVSAEVRNDAVELRGQVTRASSLDEIEALVTGVPGVGSVANKLVVAA